MRQEERTEISLYMSARDVRELILEALKERGNVAAGCMATDIDFTYEDFKDPVTQETRRVIEGAVMRWVEERKK